MLPSSKTLPKTQAVASLVFLNGIRTLDPNLNLQFEQPTYDDILKQINITVVTNAVK